MNNNAKKNNEYYVIDVIHIVKSVWRRAWLVAMVSIITAAIGFSFAKFSILPTYQSSILLYVNNSSLNIGDVGVSLSSSDLNASQHLVKTYQVLLKNRTTLTEVINETDVDRTWGELNSMISATAENETEVMKITVTSTDPYEAKTIANGIAEVLPKRVNEIVEGTSVAVVDSAVANLAKVSPSISKFTIGGFVVGFVFIVAILVIFAIMDNTIHDDEYIRQNYNYPILAKVPDLVDDSKGKYGYYYKYKKKSYGGYGNNPKNSYGDDPKKNAKG